jgi:hypothetical protein
MFMKISEISHNYYKSTKKEVHFVVAERCDESKRSVIGSDAVAVGIGRAGILSVWREPPDSIVLVATLRTSDKAF